MAKACAMHLVMSVADGSFVEFYRQLTTFSHELFL